MSEDTFKEILHILGDALGEVIIEQSGKELFEKVEKIRLLSKNLREKYNAENFGDLYNELDQYIKSLSITETSEISRSFTVYLMLNNIAELVFRSINKEQNYKSEISEVINNLMNIEDRKLEIQQYLKNFRYRIVLTQHPTEVRRKTIILKEKDIYKSLLKYLNGNLSKELLNDGLKEIIESLWLTAEVRLNKPTVNDEIEAAGAYANYSLFDVITDIVHEFWEELGTLDPKTNYSFSPLIDVGTWVGGDRDGNPFVTVEETKYALNYNRNLIINHYITEMDKIYEKVSISTRRVDKILPSFKRKLDFLLDTSTTLPDRIKELNDEPYRQWIGICKHKLQKTISQEVDFKEGFKTYIEFREMIQNLIDALNFIKTQNIIKGFLTKFIRKIDIFGFYFAKLDIRQHSEIFENLINEIYQLTNQQNEYKSLRKSEKINLIKKSLNSPRIAIFVNDLSDESKELWELFEFLLSWCELNGSQTLGSIIISMTQDESDILEVLLLQYWIGLYDPRKKRHPLPIVPLFETISSLRDSIKIMDFLWSEKDYSTILEQSELYQEIMIGYSDSAKDGGFLSSQWNIYQTQERLLELVKISYPNIHLCFFHGRGGSVGRGGGPPKSAILGLPPMANIYGMKITEQGEVISQKYLHKEIAREMLTQTFLAIHTSNIHAYKQKENLLKKDRDLLDVLTSISEREFGILTEKEEFIRFFEEASPIEFIGNLNIGSRPAKRKETKKITDLRAIPWIFAWTQNRLLFPVWYGVGTALEELYKNQDNYNQLCELMEKWPFFLSLIDNLSTQLLKVDMNSVRKYSNLTKEKQIFIKMFKEYFKTRRNVRKLSHDPHIKTQNPFLRKAIEARTPYLDPLTLIQVNAIEQYRKNQDKDLLEIILLTVNGIAVGMKNTG